MRQPRPTEQASGTPDVPLDVQTILELERIEQEIEKVVVELQYDLDIYPKIGDDIKNSKTSKERAGWKNVQKLLRKGIRNNLELLDRYAEFHSFEFPERHRHLLTINPPPAEGGENWVVESRLRYLTRVHGNIPLPSTSLAPVVLRRRIRVVFDASTARRS